MLGEPYLETVNVSKFYRDVTALRDVCLSVRCGEVVCLLGDNGAGKSTLIHILSGVEKPDLGTIRVSGIDVKIGSPAQARDRGIATVFQDLALVPMMPVYRNFFLGREPTIGWGPFQRFNSKAAIAMAEEALRDFGVGATAVRLPIGALSSGQRQGVAVGRALYFGSRILILDEPTSALGVRQVEVVLGHIRRAKEAGVGIILVTHNVQHAYAIGDKFVVLFLGRQVGTFDKSDLTEAQLTRMMAGII
ncbi:ATP-binding cassette domain-containing protein [Rhizobium leguminosarum]|uniref:ATP-binding cassette domain-containing protein n=1 Tax=Rhizobium leguminosarum TaxID=384 RepID=UPI0010300328|nr:ATP-binding cassette domain-containing protein [Rhizobium leguminosarum]QIO76706.1 sugar ABC transporter ATP-binding protein [Rhizobium leguminosarum bv. trifolii]QIO83726.1 sugar ABC transporter ATP-binding protein [Rhizobium leguminosarum bv. trifolii]TAU16483.1 sugar ABC transporter ATP-binding protein [Rhizobium leguminosarum]TAU34822.1 sugar ABC transporter ATP-binding protein [Rhizobium leguminosarum]TAX43998.1 sugar ABC transporter ATP-binding protein [Rhizobium leguminosarum]